MTTEAVLYDIFKDVSERLKLTKTRKDRNVEGRAGFAYAAKHVGLQPDATIGAIILKDRSNVVHLCKRVEQGFYKNSPVFAESYKMAEMQIKYRLLTHSTIEEAKFRRLTIEEELEKQLTTIKEAQEICEELAQRSESIEESIGAILSYSKRLKRLLSTNY